MAPLRGPERLPFTPLRAILETDYGNYQAMTPLMMASAGGHPRVVELLLEAGADPTARDESSATPRKLAEDAGHTEVVALLEQHEH